MDTSMEIPGYTVREVEQRLGLPRRIGYKLIKDGKIQAFRDCTGRLRVPILEVYAFEKNQSK